LVILDLESSFLTLLGDAENAENFDDNTSALIDKQVLIEFAIPVPIAESIRNH